MRQFAFAVIAALFCLTAPPSSAQQGPVKEVIALQIDAFKADDFATAFGFASPTIQRIFGSPDNFAAMVKGGFPMVWRPADIRFLGLEARDGAVWQDVMIRDQQGRVHILEYQMIEGEEGWKINGVRLKAPGAGSA